MLTGVRLSRVQDAALELILIDEERLKGRDFVERFKLALIANDPDWAKTVFPRWPHKAEGTEEVQYEYVDDLDMDTGTEGSWVMPEMTAEEREKLLAETLSNPRGTFTMDDMDNEEEEGWI